MNALAKNETACEARQSDKKSNSAREDSPGHPVRPAKTPPYMLTDELVMSWLQAVNRSPKRKTDRPSFLLPFFLRKVAHG